MKIYITHCCAKKDITLKGSGIVVTPDKLYIATPTRRFMNKCIEKDVEWAIFSDQYGVWFSKEKHEWYEKNPTSINCNEYQLLLNNFDDKLKFYDQIWFYYNPGRFHPLYNKLLKETILVNQVKKFTHINEIN